MTTGSDEELLRLIEDGRLIVCPQTLEVRIWHFRKRVWIIKKPDQHPRTGRYRFRFGPKRRTVYRNRLVWMFFNRKVPSAVIDHKDLNRLNDSPDNLQEMSHADSRKQGYEIQRDAAMRDFFDWWDFVRFYGHPPPDGHDTPLGSLYADE